MNYTPTSEEGMNQRVRNKQTHNTQDNDVTTSLHGSDNEFDHGRTHSKIISTPRKIWRLIKIFNNYWIQLTQIWETN